MPIWIIVLSALFFILTLFRLELALLLLVAALPSYLIRFHILGIPFTFLEIMILISFSVWFFKYFVPNLKILIKNKTQKIPYPFSWEIISVLILSLFAVGVAGFTNGALGIWKAYFFEPALLFILLFNVFKNKKDWLKIFWALAISAAVVSLFAIFQKITGMFISNPFWAQADTRRVVSFFGYPNAVGLYLAPIITILSGLLFYEHNKYNLIKKIIISIIIIVSFLAIYFAHSEGALIGLLAAITVFGFFANRKSRIITLICLVVALISIFSFAPLRNKALEKITLSDLSGEIRKQQWRETMKVLTGPKFWLGAGLDSYQEAVAPYHQEGIFFNRDKIENFHAKAWASAELREKYWQPVEVYLYPHNIFLNFWSELGLLGALLFIWIIIKHSYSSLKLTIAYGREKKPEKYLALGLLAAMVAIIIHGLVDVPYFKNDLSVLFWLIVASTTALNLSYKREQEFKN
ncbi:MAG: O-antigen ligase family protein [Patescibacteria group bacterium]